MQVQIHVKYLICSNQEWGLISPTSAGSWSVGTSEPSLSLCPLSCSPPLQRLLPAEALCGWRNLLLVPGSWISGGWDLPGGPPEVLSVLRTGPRPPSHHVHHVNSSCYHHHILYALSVCQAYDLASAASGDRWGKGILKEFTTSVITTWRAAASILMEHKIICTVITNRCIY